MYASVSGLSIEPVASGRNPRRDGVAPPCTKDARRSWLKTNSAPPLSPRMAAPLSQNW